MALRVSLSDVVCASFCPFRSRSVSSTQCRYAEAEPLLKEALEIQEKALGPDHPQVAKVLLD